MSQRPWGQFEQFTLNERTTVKVITVEPSARLSKQRHTHRAEHWQVLDGPVEVEVDERARTARHGEVVWVPQGSVHRMGNSGTTAVRVLEVGYGHFDEADTPRSARSTLTRAAVTSSSAVGFSSFTRLV